MPDLGPIEGPMGPLRWGPLKVGGNESDVSPAPEPGNRFRLRLRLRCVRACERTKLPARDDSSVARARRANLWVVRRPSVVVVRRRRPGGHLDEKFAQ